MYPGRKYAFATIQDTAIVHLAEQLTQKAAKFDVQGLRWRIPCHRRELRIADCQKDFGFRISDFEFCLTRVAFYSPTIQLPNQFQIRNPKFEIRNSLPIVADCFYGTAREGFFAGGSFLFTGGLLADKGVAVFI